MDFILKSYVSFTWMLIWKIFLNMDLRFRDNRMSRFCSKQVFNKWDQFSHNKGLNFCVVSCFESLDLRREMTVMPLDRVSRRDKVVSEHSVMILMGIFLVYI